MTKILGTLLILFVIVDIVLAFVFFGPKGLTSPILKILPKNCKVVDSKHCKGVSIVGNEKLNETVVALFSVPEGTKVYSPVDGQLSFTNTPDSEKITYHMVTATDGALYVFVFDPVLTPRPRQVKAGELIGTATGKKHSLLKGFTLAVSTIKDQRFGKAQFDSLFR